MNKLRTKILTGVGLSVLALAVCVSTSWAESPVSEVFLGGYAVPYPDGSAWPGTASITIDGVQYEGTVFWVAGETTENKNSWHGFATATYDFGELGSFEIWERSVCLFDVVEKAPFIFYRGGPYCGINLITDGTGAFEDAFGVLHYDGYLWWGIDGEGVHGEAIYDLGGMIYGIEIPGE